MTQPTRSPDDPDDSVLIARWQAGDERAATLLVERHAPSLSRYVASIGVREDVEDVVQDTFIRAFGSPGQLSRRQCAAYMAVHDRAEPREG